jgi:rhamnosyltransferase
LPETDLKRDNNPDNVKVCGVLVLYNPDQDKLRKLISLFLPQLDHIFIVDNSEISCKLDFFYDLKITYYSVGENKGIAYAHNAGISWAKERDFAHVLLIDQDSIPNKDMVFILKDALNELETQGKKIAAVGPRLWDSRHFTFYPFIRFTKKEVKRLKRFQRKYVKTDFLPASGCLIPLKNIHTDKPFSEDLFIDNVDFDWCFKMSYLGYDLYGVKDAVMEHTIGECVRSLWFGKKISVFLHNPLRQYYIMRNRILLYKKKHVSSAWVKHDILRAILKFILFSLVFPPRKKNAIMMIKGIIHALKDKTGKYEE